MTEHPKVFVSHAGKDKVRFVEPFSTKLRENGVDAWVSFWEILDGESLVDKIFSEGMEQSKIFVIIISKNSEEKPWVRKEMNIAIIKQITENSKIIPILLDDCKIPTALSDTKYEVINDLINYDYEFTQIINSIFGIYKKPPLGSVPKYNSVELYFSTLSKIDNIILKICFEHFLSEDHPQTMLDTFAIVRDAEKLQIDERDAHESLLVLKTRGYLKGQKAYIGSDEILIYITFSVSGFHECASILLPNYNLLVKKTATAILNKYNEDKYQEINAHKLSEELRSKMQLMIYIFDLLDLRGLIEIQKTLHSRFVKRIRPELKRCMAN